MNTLSAQEEARYAELQALALDLARNGETHILQNMIEHGLPINLSDAKGNTLLMLASYNNHLETAKMLLILGAEVDRRNDHGQTPLGGVAFKGYLAICHALVEAGSNINADNGGGRTPIMFAALFGRVAIVEYLQSAGAKTSEQRILGFSLNSIAKAVLYVKMLFIKKPKNLPASI